jgi:hypothetical protein
MLKYLLKKWQKCTHILYDVPLGCFLDICIILLIYIFVGRSKCSLLHKFFSNYVIYIVIGSYGRVFILYADLCNNEHLERPTKI